MSEIFNATNLLKEWVWVTGVERFIERSSGRMLKPSQFDSEFNPRVRTASVSKSLFQRNELNRFESLAYRPGAAEFDGKSYNKWRASPVAAKKGDVTLWDSHIKFLFPDDATRNAALDWMAYVIQYQSKRPNQALLIVGETMGTGKSIVLRALEGIIGKENTSRPKASSLAGQFNQWAFAKKLGLIEELREMADKRERKSIAYQLRDMVTEPTIEINLKGIPQFQVENYMAICGVSNFLDALHLIQGDRRWLVALSPVTEDQKLFALDEGLGGHIPALMRWLDPANSYDDFDSGALAAIAWSLEQRDVSRFKPGEAVMTAAKADMIARSRTGFEAAIFNVLESTERDLWRAEDILEALPAREQNRAPADHLNAIGDVLRKPPFNGAKRRITLRHTAPRLRATVWGVRKMAATVADKRIGEGTLRVMYEKAKGGKPTLAVVATMDDDMADAGVTAAD